MQHVVAVGPLIPAIAASSALPGVLRPIDLDGRALIDGGFVNPVPFDLLAGHADIIAAIDVSAGPQQSRRQVPTLMETIIGSNQITLRSVTREKLKTSAPDILIRPDIGKFKVLDFYKIDEIFAASEAAKDEFKRACEAALGARKRRRRSRSRIVDLARLGGSCDGIVLRNRTLHCTDPRGVSISR